MGTKTWLAVGWVVMVASLGACGGGGGNNDQGIVFRAIGLVDAPANVTATQITCTDPTVDNVFVTTHSISLSRTESFPKRDDPDADPCGGFLQLQNNLTSQSINVQEVTVSYEVAGASISIPTNPITVGVTIPPPSVTSGSATPTNVVFLRLYTQVVPATIMTFLNQNVNRLPVTPFTMNLFITAQGQSDTGNHYTTNEVTYQLTVTS